ncbi:MAG: transcriptional regulator [Rhodobacteraceae bacterium HLUCCA12]|nr:MAG: transcriptional regulator [Rhodobacteraceae bacterium HLUCCA12]
MRDESSDKNGFTSERAQPQYLRILDILRGRIQSGLYAVDTRAPSEAELCDEFGVSRQTVREALRKLSELGFVERRRGSRTRVVSDNPTPVYTQSMFSLSELFQYALDTHFEIERAVPVRLGPDTAGLVAAPEGSEWLCISGVRRTAEDGSIICHTSAYINKRFAWLRDELLAYEGPFYALVETRGNEPIAEATQTFNAVEMPAAVRQAFGNPGWPVALRLVRRYHAGSGEVMVASVNHHPADRFTYTIRLQREDFSGERASQG